MNIVCMRKFLCILFVFIHSLLFFLFFLLFDLCLPRPGGQLWWIVVQYSVILSIPPFFIVLFFSPF